VVAALAVLSVLAGVSACTTSKANDGVTSTSAGSSSPATSSAVVSSASAPQSGAPSVAYGTDPLTGAPAATGSAAQRPALAVKVDNVAGAWPQAGLNQADIVFDLPVEGGLTRLLAVFHSQDVAQIGPIRSARPVDADILHLFGHAYFAFSGGTASDLAPLADHSNATTMWWDVTPSLFVVRSDHAVPHQVFATTAMLYAGGQQRSPSTTPPPAIFGYAEKAPDAAPAATSVTAQYDAATATWNWNGTSYLRTQDGHADMLLDGSQVSAANVVVMSVAVASTSAHDSHGSVVPLPVVIGSGTVWVFRDGVMVKGTWSRPTESSPMKLTASSGQPITLAPGRTWVEVLPNSRQPKTQ
jgi:hypothetical protein